MALERVEMSEMMRRRARMSASEGGDDAGGWLAEKISRASWFVVLLFHLSVSKIEFKLRREYR